ncbi:MAG: helix-turn-helix domain-containing protein [Asgard group archaeon]|nr:helix-turn-helix domain-containing protein [Asgard group archaeon]
MDLVTQFSKKTLRPTEDVWLDTSEAARILKVSTRTLQNYRDNGTLPFSKIGSKIYFKATDIEGLLTEHYIKS